MDSENELREEHTAIVARSEVEPATKSIHENHCFIVMPFGRDRNERNWFRGWYEVVIQPAVVACGYDPILSAAEEHSGAINDEIRSHLAFDKMVIVDLGGLTSDDSPNPNVMYELGIRHAFGLPLVLMAWEGQSLPFDVSNQRAIMSGRSLLEIEPTKQKLIRFIQFAEEGKYYKPMEVVGREAALDVASLTLTEESLLGALTREIRDIRKALGKQPKAVSKPSSVGTVKSILPKTRRKELWPIGQLLGMNVGTWGKFLGTKISPTLIAKMNTWSDSEWQFFMQQYLTNITQQRLTKNNNIEEETKFKRRTHKSTRFVEEVAELLPEQPWPKGIHREIAVILNTSGSQVQRAINTLIKEGRFVEQINGELVTGDSPSQAIDSDSHEDT